jgi:GMP synthase-like glutamine amidotransferase
MHLAVLMTNTDETDFAQRHPKDAEKFATMIEKVRPDWTVESFSVKDGVFPTEISAFDGIIITGSPASVHDGTAWIERLEEVVRSAFTKGLPMFGACFGHQVIAQALGGRVGPNPEGWVFGIATAQSIAPPKWADGIATSFRQYAAHIEQVTELPKDAKIWASAPNCPVVGFTVGDQIFTTQNHPEMTHDFMQALVEEYGSKLPREVIERAQQSLSEPVDDAPFNESIARFFENAVEAPQATACDPNKA